MIRSAGSGISGEPYVHWCGCKKKWRVEIWRNNIRYRYGRFSTVARAAEVARQQAAILDAIHRNYNGRLTATERKQIAARRAVERRKWKRSKEGAEVAARKPARITRSNKQLYRGQHKSL